MAEDRPRPLSARERKICSFHFPASEGLCTVTSYWGLTIEKACPVSGLNERKEIRRAEWQADLPILHAGAEM